MIVSLVDDGQAVCGPKVARRVGRRKKGWTGGEAVLVINLTDGRGLLRWRKGRVSGSGAKLIRYEPGDSVGISDPNSKSVSSAGPYRRPRTVDPRVGYGIFGAEEAA